VTKNRAQEVIQKRDNSALYAAKKTEKIFYLTSNFLQASSTLRLDINHKN
jgi:hypothetical protein